MADIYGSYFEYGGILSREYGLILANVRTSRQTKLSGDIKGNTIFNKNTKQRLLTGNDYSSFPVSFDVDIITDDESDISMYHRRIIEKWLFNRREYKKLYIREYMEYRDQSSKDEIWDDLYSDVYDLVDGVVKRLYLNCRFLNAERLEYNGGVVGYKATIEADSGLWWQDPITYTHKRSKTESGKWRFVIPVNTDLDDYTYPKVEVLTGKTGGAITITNTTDGADRKTKFRDIPAQTRFSIDGSVNFVSNDFYGKMTSQFFPRLLDGDNQFTIEGDVSEISFTFSNRRML